MVDTLLACISFFASASSIVFAYLAFRRSREKDYKDNGRSEGVMFSDIGYIKACIDRVEKSINKVDDLYRGITERLARLEETVSNLNDRVEEHLHNNDN